MKSLRHLTLAAALLAALAYVQVSAKNHVVPKAYMFGFSASFNDSIVYFTDIQEVDSVWLTGKKNMLAGRGNYSYQLRNFFTNERDMPHRTCIVVSDVKLKNVEKKYNKMKKQYTGGKNAGKYDVRFLPATEFKFTSVNMDDSDEKK
ncbi:MAG: hypothetical protein IJ067_02195 [Prevotella sp.]|nr:hypothetical protein [Prevotella sp.]